MENTIRLIGGCRLEEAPAQEAILPGNLISLQADGSVAKNATEGGHCERAVAREDVLQGKTVDDAYAISDVVSYWLPQKGDEVQYILKGGSTVVKGNQLISAGDGTLIPTADATSPGVVLDIVGIAVDDLDLNALPDALLAVRVM